MKVPADVNDESEQGTKRFRAKRDAILAAASDDDSSVKPRPRTSLLESRDYIDAARTVVAVRQDLPVEVPSPLPAADPDGLRAFGERWGVGSPVERLLAQL